MANSFPNVFKVSKQTKHRSTFPLDTRTMTTMDFGKTNVSFCMELAPNDEIDLSSDVLCQLAPMVVPTMGQVVLHNRLFFVPYRFVWKGWEDFFSQKSLCSDGSGVSAPTKVISISSSTISSWFFHVDGSLHDPFVSPVDSNSAFDFYDGTTYFVCNYYGRLYSSILYSLGYTIFPELSGDVIHSYSALPLLSLVKIFRDFYVNPNYDYSSIDAILNLFVRGGSANIELNNRELNECMNFVGHCWYEGDILNQAWASPETPGYATTGVTQGQFKVSGIDASAFGDNGVPFDSDTGSVLPVAGKNPVFNGSPQLTSLSDYSNSGIPSGLNHLTEVGLNLLKAVRDFTLRQGIAGGRYIDQLLSRFGVHLSDEASKRSTFIGSFTCDVNISRVDATAAGESGNEGFGSSSSLGDFTGRGTMGGNGHFHYKNKDDFGFLVMVSTLLPVNDYFQGIKPHCDRIGFYDFFNGDLEDVGLAPIPMRQVFYDYYGEDEFKANSVYEDSVFGFAPNYWQYKTNFSTLSGDFRMRSKNAEIRSFHMFRELAPINNPRGRGGIPAILDEEFQRATRRSVRVFDKIFIDQTDDADHFIVSFKHQVRATRDMGSIGMSITNLIKEHDSDVANLVKVRPNGKYF